MPLIPIIFPRMERDVPSINQAGVEVRQNDFVLKGRRSRSYCSNFTNDIVREALVPRLKTT